MADRILGVERASGGVGHAEITTDHARIDQLEHRVKVLEEEMAASKSRERYMTAELRQYIDVQFDLIRFPPPRFEDRR